MRRLAANPPPKGEGDHPQGGGGARAMIRTPAVSNPHQQRPERPRVPHHHAAHGPPPRSGEDL